MNIKIVTQIYNEYQDCETFEDHWKLVLDNALFCCFLIFFISCFNIKKIYNNNDEGIYVSKERSNKNFAFNPLGTNLNCNVKA